VERKPARAHAPVLLDESHVRVEVVVHIELVWLAGLGVFLQVRDVDCC